MTSNRYKVSLRLRHPSLDLQVTDDILGLTPKTTWRAGACRVTPKGMPLEGMHADSYWTACVAEGRSRDTGLPTAIGDVIERLWPNRQFFVDLVGSGGKAELFIGWFFENGNSGDVFDWRLLERMGEMKIDLSFDAYPHQSKIE